MRSAFDDGLDEDGEPDPEAQRAALDAILAPKPAAIAPPAPAKAAGYGAGLDGAALAKAQDESAHNKWARDLSAGIYSTFSGTPRPKMEARDPSAEILQQRQGLDQEGAFTDRQQARAAKLAQEAEARDPGSEGSRLARVAIERADPQMAQQMGPQWERMSKSKLSELYGPDIVGKLLLADAHRRAAARPPKQSEDEVEAFRQQLLREHPKLDPTLVGRMGIDSLAKLQADERAKESVLATRYAADVAAGRERDRYSRDQADKVAEKKREEAEKERRDREAVQVPGLEVAPGAHPSTDDAKKVKASLASKERMGAAVNELMALHAKHGTELYGPAAARMQQLYKEILIEGKNIAELGALSGPDMGLIEDLIGADPGSVGANVKGFFGSDNTQTRLKGLQEWTNSTAQGNAKSYGYLPKAQAPARSLPPPPHPGMIRIEDASGRGAWHDPADPLPPGTHQVPNG